MILFITAAMYLLVSLVYIEASHKALTTHMQSDTAVEIPTWGKHCVEGVLLICALLWPITLVFSVVVNLTKVSKEKQGE
jgi:hypothetical protein